MNGSWSHWSQWQPCSLTCGGGHRTRTRTCNSAPQYNGQDCPGTNISTESCNLQKCIGTFTLGILLQQQQQQQVYFCFKVFSLKCFRSFNAPVCSLLFIPGPSKFLIFKIFCDCTDMSSMASYWLAVPFRFRSHKMDKRAPTPQDKWYGEDFFSRMAQKTTTNDIYQQTA